MEDDRTETERLYSAIYGNYMEGIGTCINNGVNINHTTYSLTPLEFAIHCNNLKMVQYLIMQGARYNSEHPDSPLIHCLRKNKPDIAKFLVYVGANIHQPDTAGKTPLSWAISLENEELVELFLNNGAQLTAHKDLIDAIEIDNLRIVQLLLERGASANSQDYNGLTPLLKCIETKSLDLVIFDEIKNRGVKGDINQPSIQGMALAVAFTKQVDLAKKFLRKGANVNEFNPDPWAMLTEAAELSNPNFVIMAELLRYGADVNLLTRSGTPLVKCCMETDSLRLVRNILKLGADPSQNSNGVYPIMYAIVKRNFDMVKLLVEGGADLSIVDNCGDTPILKAVGEANFAIIEYLVRAGSDLNVVNRSHETALSKALSNRDFRTLSLLLKAGADESLTARELNRNPEFKVYFMSNE